MPKRRNKSRRQTPWDAQQTLTATQEFIQMHYKAQYANRHPSISSTGEAVMINSYEPSECPYCHSDRFIRKGYDANSIRRYRCLLCGQSFKPTTGTIFGSRKISISQWIDYCLNIFRYVSLNADSWNNRNALSTSKYWLEKLFLTLNGTQNDIILSDTVWLDETLLFSTPVTAHFPLKRQTNRFKRIHTLFPGSADIRHDFQERFSSLTGTEAA